MNFTRELPTKPGYFLFKRHKFLTGRLVEVKLNEIGSLVIHGWKVDVKNAGGLWCRLVPADNEISAYNEGINKGGEIASQHFKDVVPKEEMEKSWVKACLHLAGASRTFAAVKHGEQAMKSCGELTCDECNARTERLLTEIENAFAEGYWQSHAEFAAPGASNSGLPKAWNQSRAKRVMEGRE